MPYVATACIFGLMFWMYSCNTPDAPVQVMAQPETEEPAKAEAPVVEPVPVPEVIEELAPTDE